MTRKQLSSQLRDIIEDPILFISRLSIVDKRGKTGVLKLNDEQVHIIKALHEGDDVLILKPRQIGATTAVAAYFFWKWYVSVEPTTHVILSHKMASSKHIFSIFKRFWTALPPALQKDCKVTASCMTMKDTGAQITAMSSGGDGGLRSFSASSIHISEFAFTEGADELKATAIAALNGGQLCIESTANYWGDPLHNEIQLWDAEMVEWNFLFFPWPMHREYTAEPPPGWETDPESSLTPGQQFWQARMAGKLGESKFRREYPLTVEDAYSQTDGAWIANEMLSDIQIVKLDPEGGMLAPKEKQDVYAIGVDTGAGTGGDYSALVALSCVTGQIVEIRRSNSMAPTEWAEVVADASRKWGNAKVLVESNGTWGGVVITELKHMGIPLWKDIDGNDWITNGKTKPMMLEAVKDKITRGGISILDSWTAGEFRSFKVNDRGEPFCPRGGVHHGDTVIAYALALQCVNTLRPPTQSYIPQWIKDRKVIAARNKGAFKDMRRY